MSLLWSIDVTIEIYGWESLSRSEVAVFRAEFKVSPSPTREVGDQKLRIVKFPDRLSSCRNHLVLGVIMGIEWSNRIEAGLYLAL